MRPTSTAAIAVAALLVGAVAAAPGPGARVIRSLTSTAVCSLGVASHPAPSGPAARDRRILLPRTVANAAANGVVDQVPGDDVYLATQPVQGFSAMVPAGDDTWWTLTDNGYGAKENSADYQLAVYRIDPHFQESTPEVLSATVLRDPDEHVPWQIVCDQTGDPLPDLTINILPSEPPDAWTAPAAASSPGSISIPSRSSSRRMGRSGSARSSGRPCSTSTPPAGSGTAHRDTPGIKAPQNPTLDVAGGEQPNVATSRGFEGLAISPTGRTLYPLLEGAVGSDHPQDVLMLTFDILTSPLPRRRPPHPAPRCPAPR